MADSLSITLTTASDAKVERVDRWLADSLADSSPESDCLASVSLSQPLSPQPLSRSRIKALIEGGHLTCSGQVVLDPSAKIRPNANYCLTIPPPTPATPQAQHIPLNILYEDADIIVIDKPAGLVVHPAPGTPDGTLVNALIAHCGASLTGIGGEMRPGIVHRLDKNTSGVMVAAKTALAHQRLTTIFAAHDLERIYTAVVWGVAQGQISVDKPIGRSRHHRKKMAVNPKGRQALTHIDFTQTLPPLASLAHCRLETGRTHQIRVHTAAIGHSVIGDVLYGAPMRMGQMPDKALQGALAILRAFPRQALHATHLGFNHPISATPLHFQTPLPDDMEGLLRDLKEALEKRGRG